MLTVSTGEQGSDVADSNIYRSRSGELSQRARKKARCGVSTSRGAKDDIIRVSLRLDVNASRLASPGHATIVRRSPIAFDRHVGDEGMDETSDSGKCA